MLHLLLLWDRLVIAVIVSGRLLQYHIRVLEQIYCFHDASDVVVQRMFQLVRLVKGLRVRLQRRMLALSWDPAIRVLYKGRRIMLLF